MDDTHKEVNFEKYCKMCKYYSINENEDPCEECLTNPTNLYSEKPINWKDKGNYK